MFKLTGEFGIQRDGKGVSSGIGVEGKDHVDVYPTLLLSIDTTLDIYFAIF